jgi:DNA mismatch endonuclease (patch repair protein)
MPTTSAARSHNMSAIKGAHTRPERLIRSLLHRRGYRFRLQATDLPGKPDIVLPRYHAVILIHGCFWHGHNCPLFHWPKTRAEFWREKIGKNKLRDQRNQILLHDAGWRVAIVWECVLRGKAEKYADLVAAKLIDWLESQQENLIVD